MVKILGISLGTYLQILVVAVFFCIAPILQNIPQQSEAASVHQSEDLAQLKERVQTIEDRLGIKLTQRDW